MVIRAAILAALLAATCRAAWSPEWTDGTQTNALFIYEPHHYMEVVHAVNERVIAANFSMSDFWAEGEEWPSGDGPIPFGALRDQPGVLPSLIDTNSAYYAGSTNAFWRPSAEGHAELVGKVVDLTRYFTSTNAENEQLTLLNDPLDGFYSVPFQWFAPRWAYGLGTLKHNYESLNGSWTAMTNFPIFHSLPPMDYFAWRALPADGADDLAYVLAVPVEVSSLSPAGPVLAGTATQTLREAYFAVGTNDAVATISNGPARIEYGAWTYDAVVIRLDPTNFSFDSGAISYRIVSGGTNLVYAPVPGMGVQTNAPDNANHSSSIPLVMGLSTNTFNPSLSTSTNGVLGVHTNQGIVGVWFHETTVASTNGFPNKIVAEYVGLAPSGASSSGSSLRDGWSDWAVPWLELVWIKSLLSRMAAVPTTLCFERIADWGLWQTNVFGSTNLILSVCETNAEGFSCGNLPSIPTGEEQEFDRMQPGQVWDWASSDWGTGMVGRVYYSAPWNYILSVNPLDHEGRSGWPVGEFSKRKAAWTDDSWTNAPEACAYSTMVAHDYYSCLRVPSIFLTNRNSATSTPSISKVRYWKKISTRSLVGTNYVYDIPGYGQQFGVTETASALPHIVFRDERGWLGSSVAFMRVRLEDFRQEVWEWHSELSGDENCIVSTNWQESYNNNDPVISSGVYPVENRKTISATALVIFGYEYP